MNCIFCDIIKRKKEDYIVWEDENYLLLLNIKTKIPGTTMLIPKQHVDYIFDLPEETYTGLFQRAKELAPKIKKIFNAQRIGLFSSGFEVPHVHLFLVPMSGPHQFIRQEDTIDLEKEELQELQEKIIAGL